MLLDTLVVGTDAFTNGTGWAVKPEGVCHGDVCVPLPDGMADSDMVHVVTVAVFERGGMAAARALIDKHQPEHPALYDGDHLLEAHLGLESVSTWLWADEEQRIVRAPEFVMAHEVPASAGGDTGASSFLPPALAES